MAVTLEELRATLRMEMKPFMRDLQQINGISAKSARLMESTWAQTSKKLDGFGKNMAKSLIMPMAGIGAALGTRELAQLADTWSDLSSRVNLAAGSQQKGVEVIGRLGEMARMTYSGLELTTESYLSNSGAIMELGYSTDQALDYTEALNNSLVVSGAKGERAKSVIDALSKAMALGKLSGDNLNTVISTGGRAAEALAAGLGTTVGGLRTLGAQGKITGRDIVTALTSQMATLRKEAESMPATISDGFQLLNNAMLQYVGNADTATGISAKVAEALIIIADNFDKVADTGLQVAAVIAGALVGRSLTGMIAKLALSTAELKKFISVLSTARTLGGMATAMTGLSAAAGPLGLIVGGAVVGSMVSLSMASAEAARRTDDVTQRLQDMGLLAKQAAENVEEAAKSVEELSAIEKVRVLREINAELDRMRGGGTFFSQGDEFNSILAEAAKADGLFGTSKQEDGFALERIQAIAQASRDSKMAASDALAELRQLEQTDVSKPILELIKQLQRSVEYFNANKLAAASLGDTSEIDKLAEHVAKAREEIATVATVQAVSEEQKAQIDSLIRKFEDSKESAEDTNAALQKIASTEPNIAPYLTGIQKLITALEAARVKAVETAAAAQAAMNGNVPEKSVEAYKQYQNSRSEGEVIVAQRKAYEQDAIRKSKLGKDQYALEEKIAAIKAKSLKDGVELTEDAIRRIAQAQLDGEKSRTDEGKKPKREKHKKTGEDFFDAEIQQVKDRTVALAEEARVTGLTYVEQEKRMMALDLEQSVLQRLREEARQKGVTDLDSIKLSPSQVSAINAVSEAYANQADELRKVQEAQNDAENAAQQFSDSMRSGFVGLVTGANSFKDALSGLLKKLSELLLNSAFTAFMGGSGTTQSGGWLTGVMKAIGFAEGGYTGDGGKYEAKGIVHGGEFVFDKQATAKAGVGNLEALRRNLKGYANGGYVGTPTMPSISLPKTPEIKAPSGLGRQPQKVVISVDVTGATGNTEIQEMVDAGVSKGIQRFTKDPSFSTLVGSAVGKARGMNKLR